MNINATDRHRPPQSALLARADLVFLLSELLRPPATAQAARWGQAQEVLDELLSAADLDAPDLRAVVTEAVIQAVETPPTTKSAEYYRLFEGKLLCPPNQTAYVRRDKGAVLADVCGFYRAFGFDARPETGEKPDHIVTELEFCGVLLAMTAGAADREHAQIAEDALADFADSHVGEWLPWFTARLQAVSQLPYYGLVAVAILQSWLALSAGHGLRTTPSAPMEHPQETPDDPYQCGGSAQPHESRVTLGVGRDRGVADACAVGRR